MRGRQSTPCGKATVYSTRAITVFPFRTCTIMVFMLFCPSRYLRCSSLARAVFHTWLAVLRTPNGILVMAPRLRVGTECSGMELAPYALNQIGLRGNFQMSFVCEKDRLCGKLIRQCHRKATKPRLVSTFFGSEEQQPFPTMTCTLPDFLVNRFL